MKTAISLPDPLFEESEKLAKRLRISRSQLYARALDEYVSRRRSEEIREAYDRVYGEPETEEDRALSRALQAAALATLRRNEW
jgi:metal-responsive CopG/Arc/MetJ family transcriptional regulator